jgi:hypothetical protein
MAIIRELSRSGFIGELKKCCPNNFSDSGMDRLYEYQEELSKHLWCVLDFDPVGVCCELWEYSDIEEYNEENGTEYEDAQDVAGFACMIDDKAFLAHI